MQISRASLSALFLALAASGAHATVIDTTASYVGDIHNFGYPDTATYGQTFTVTGTDTVLNSFSLYLNGDYTQDVRGYIGTWDGSKVTNLLYTSNTVSVSGSGTHELSFAPGGLMLTAGGTYVAFLSISELPMQPFAYFGMPAGADSIPGQFVFINNSTNFSQLTNTAWTTNWSGNADVWFKADLGSPVSQVPEPTSLALASVGLAALLGRRKAAQA